MGMGVDDVLRAQAGVISRAQASAAGLSSDQIDRRLASGSWWRLNPRVYLSADRELTGEASVRAAVLWAGDGAVLCGVAAAWWHGRWSELPQWLGVTIPARRRVRPPPDIRVRRRDLDRRDRTEVRGVPVTAPALTVLEAATELGRRGAELVDRSLQRWVSFDALHAAHSRNLGRHGSPAAGSLLTVAADRAASHAERLAIGLLRAARLTGWQLGYPVAGYTVDIAFHRHRVAIEIDGWAWHHDAARFRRDRCRQNALVLAGWTVLRFTWWDLTDRPAAVVAEIRAMLADARAA